MKLLTNKIELIELVMKDLLQNVKLYEELEILEDQIKMYCI